MNRLLLWALALAMFNATATRAAEFPGWQAMRVIEQKGRPNLMRQADLNGDGREELLVVNSRSSRLDIYAWHKQSDEEESEASDNPNDLPMASDFEHLELQLENVPRDVLPCDIDGDGRLELVVLVTTPNQVQVFQSSDGQQWEKQYKIDLLEGDLPSRRESLLVRKSAADELQLLVSMDNGIQQVELKQGGRAEWMTPREQRGRLAWWLADINSDGHDDLVEQTRESNESVRWYRANEHGELTPAATLLDRAVDDVAVLRASDQVEIDVIDGAVSGILRRYRLETGEENALGLQRPLALAGSPKAVWCGMMLGDQRALVTADSEAPRLLSYVLGESGWETQQAFPAVSDIQALATLAAEPGALLLWTKDAADLRKSRWQGERLTYPEPYAQSSDVEDRKILALDTVGSITWWVQKVGKDLDLYLARPDAAEPSQVRFVGAGAKADQVLWIGGERLLMKEAHSRALNLVEHAEDKAKVTSPTHLKKANLTEYKLFALGDKVQLGRLTDGVLQWLGDDLRSQEQVMLPQGQKLTDYVADGESAGWALQNASPYVHRIEVEGSRLSRSTDRIKVPSGVNLVRDPVLGMLLLGDERITHLSAGSSSELKLIDVIDERVGRAGGIRKTRFHALGTLDIDRDGYEDLLLFDRLEHRLTVLGAESEAGSSEALSPKISWPVFDDKIYPYSDEMENLISEPRAVLAADFDGDQLQDLALLSQDRLIIYLARERF